MKKRYVPIDLVRGTCELCGNRDNYLTCETCKYQPMGSGKGDCWFFIDQSALKEIETETAGEGKQPPLPLKLEI